MRKMSCNKETLKRTGVEKWLNSYELQLKPKRRRSSVDQTNYSSNLSARLRSPHQ